jgi:hypothetical protein
MLIPALDQFVQTVQDNQGPSLRNRNNPFPQGLDKFAPQAVAPPIAPAPGESDYQRGDELQSQAQGMQTQAYGMTPPHPRSVAFRTKDLIALAGALFAGKHAGAFLQGYMGAKQEKAQADSQYELNQFLSGQKAKLSQAQGLETQANQFFRRGDMKLKEAGDTTRNDQTNARILQGIQMGIAGREKINTDDNAAAAERLKIKGTLDERKLTLGTLSRAANNQNLDPSVREIFGRQAAQMLTNDPELVDAMAKSMGKPSAANINAQNNTDRTVALVANLEKRGRMLEKEIGAFDRREADRIWKLDTDTTNIEKDNDRADKIFGVTAIAENNKNANAIMGDAQSAANAIRSGKDELEKQINAARASRAKLEGDSEEAKGLDQLIADLEKRWQAKSKALSHYKNIWSRAKAQIKEVTPIPIGYTIDPNTGQPMFSSNNQPTLPTDHNGRPLTGKALEAWQRTGGASPPKPFNPPAPGGGGKGRNAVAPANANVRVTAVRRGKGNK